MQVQDAFDLSSSAKFSNEVMLEVQAYLGASWVLGCLSFGFIVILKPRGCMIDKTHLCIFSLVICGLACFLLPSVIGEAGQILFTFVYGVFAGGFHYAFKMQIFDLARSRNFARIWSYVQGVMGFSVMLGLPLSSYLGHGFSGLALMLAALTLVLGDRYHQYLRAKKRYEAHMKRCAELHNNLTETGTMTGQPCSSLVVHQCDHDHDHDFFDGETYDSQDEDDEDDSEIPARNAIIEIYKNRHTSPEAMLEWKAIEKELFGGDNDNNQLESDDLRGGGNFQPHPEEAIERGQNEITSSAKVEDKIVMSEFAQNFTRGQTTMSSLRSRLQAQNPPGSGGSARPSFQPRNRLGRQMSDEIGFVSSSTSTSGSGSGSSSGGYNGLPVGNPRYKMSAALSAAMVTAAIPVARPVPAAGPGHKPSQAIPEIHAIRNRAANANPTATSGWQKQRSITVIEEVSA